MYLQTKDPQYLEKAKIVWRFIESGTDEQLVASIGWNSGNGLNMLVPLHRAVYALKLFEATGDSYYFEKGKHGM